MFQRDGVTIQTTKDSRKRCCDNNIALLPWLARSPDLNLIENLFSILSTKVYANKKQFPSIRGLKEFIQYSLDGLHIPLLLKLVEFPYKRCADVLDRKRADKDY